jgi:hypothetical protein
VIHAPAAAVAEPPHGRSVSFSDLVWAHFLHQRALDGRSTSQGADLGADSRIYYDVLARFEESHGRIIASMFGAGHALGVAVTEREVKRSVLSLLRANPQPIHELHRDFAWTVEVPSELAAALHEGDLLAIQASSVLRRGPARAVILRVFAAQSYLLETIDRGVYESEEAAAESSADEAPGEVS